MNQNPPTTEQVKEIDMEEFAKQIYEIGFSHGAQEMKNKVLKSINRDITLFTTKNETVAVLKKVQKLKLPKATTPPTSNQ